MSQQSLLESRLACPCCGYPTLEETGAYEICELCNWEDDGQGDEAADEVWGGPNGDYSLSDARGNFRLYRVMYSPGRYKQFFGGDTQLEYETKGLLMSAFDELRGSKHPLPELEAEIFRLEKVLDEETSRQVREYERQHSPDA